jgi:hypothetical protein
VYYALKAGMEGRSERVYYICYRKDGKLVEELAGGQFQDNMTAEGAGGSLHVFAFIGDPTQKRIAMFAFVS